MIGVVVGIGVVTAVGLKLGHGQGPPSVYGPSTYAPPRMVPGPPTAELGEDVFEAKGCLACHTTDGSARVGPSFAGRWGAIVTLTDGTQVVFDERYVRDSLATPQAQAQAGYPPAMPSYDGVLKPGEIAALVEYFKSL